MKHGNNKEYKGRNLVVCFAISHGESIARTASLGRRPCGVPGLEVRESRYAYDSLDIVDT